MDSGFGYVLQAERTPPLSVCRHSRPGIAAFVIALASLAAVGGIVTQQILDPRPASGSAIPLRCLGLLGALLLAFVGLGLAAAAACQDRAKRHFVILGLWASAAGVLANPVGNLLLMRLLV
ncbi:MAG: hypothetical protein KGY99_10185 [Phycisphaerae bacterium]|nr:hypothetical protein [Phycisphaerae bacterium]